MIRRYAELSRLLLVVVCLVPFTSTRQAAVVCASAFPAAPVESQVPVNEEEDERENETETDGKERFADPVRHRITRESTDRLPAVHAGHTSALVLCARQPAPADPFNNGLGTHYRC